MRPANDIYQDLIAKVRRDAERYAHDTEAFMSKARADKYDSRTHYVWRAREANRYYRAHRQLLNALDGVNK